MLLPSAARVTSVKLSLEKSLPKTLSRLVEWLFHLRQNWWWDISMVNLKKKIIHFFFQSNVIRASIMRWRKRAFFPSCYFFDVVTLLLSFSLYSFLFFKKKFCAFGCLFPSHHPLASLPGKEKTTQDASKSIEPKLVIFRIWRQQRCAEREKTKHFANDSKNQFRVDERPRKKKKRKLTGKKNNFLKNFLHKREI